MGENFESKTSGESKQFEEVEFDIGDGKKEKVQCELVDLRAEDYNKAVENAEWYKKSVEIRARQAIKQEKIETALDATKNVAGPGDWIVTNPGGEEYVIRAEKFAKLYEPKEGEPGLFVSKGVPVRAVRTEKNITFIAPWGEMQSVREGGYVIDNNGERYGIDRKAFTDTYKKVEIEKGKEEE